MNSKQKVVGNRSKPIPKLSNAQIARFWERVYNAPYELAGGCIIWTRWLDPDGYGVFSTQEHGPLRAHRIAYTLAYGDIPYGLVIDHICTFRACVNPLHLRAVTIGENTRTGNSPCMQNSRKSECNKGHPYNKVNTYLRPSGGRGCKQCRNDAAYKYKDKYLQRVSYKLYE